MSESFVKQLQIVPGVKGSHIGSATVLVSFVDDKGNPVDVGGGGGGAAPVPEDRLVPEGGTVGQVLTRGAGGAAAWAADQNTAYPALTAAQATAGTATAPSTISAKVLADEVERRVNARVAAAIQPFEARIAALEAK